MSTFSTSPLDWRARFLQQASWTRDLRRYLYARVDLGKARRVLDVGCGTGALLPELLEQAGGPVFGLDISLTHLEQAAGEAYGAQLVLGDAHRLPLKAHSFDVVLCHFVLLWLADPAAALAEMVRLLRPGGTLLALAEPDYGGRIDHPPELESLGIWQRCSLDEQGADPFMGRRLPGLLFGAGLVQVESGVLGAQWSGLTGPAGLDMEWAVLEHDLRNRLELPDDLDLQLDNLRIREEQAWASGERVLYVPTFYAWGRVSG
jgi:SAM-dependent methyltransferase